MAYPNSSVIPVLREGLVTGIADSARREFVIGQMMVAAMCPHGPTPVAAGRSSLWPRQGQLAAEGAEIIARTRIQCGNRAYATRYRSQERVNLGRRQPAHEAVPILRLFLTKPTILTLLRRSSE